MIEFATPVAMRVFAAHAGGIARRVFATPAAMRVFAAHAGGFGGFALRVVATLPAKKNQKTVLAGDWVSLMVLVECHSGGSEGVIVFWLHLASSCVWLLTSKLPAPEIRST